MVNLYTADLHIHSVLSPCGDLSMSPGAIVRRARELGLDLLALTDHNMCENGIAMRDAARDSGISLLYGMELETAEELHLLCLFDTLDDSLAWQEVAYAHLPAIANDPERFGDQVVVNADEDIVRFEMRLLANATTLPLEEACALVEERGGLPVPAHVDRPVLSLVSQLGLPPDDLTLAAVELSRHASPEFLRQHAFWLDHVPQVRFSDAHFVRDIGRQRTLFRMGAPTIAEIRLALRGEGGRSMEGLSTEQWIQRVVERAGRPG